MYWFHNHTRGASSGTGKRGVLKLRSKTKLLQPWQAYQSLYYKTKLRPLVDAAWGTYKAGFAAGTKPEKSRFAFMNDMVQDLYEAETAEVREKVEEHRLKLKVKGDCVDDDEGQNQCYQR